MNSEELGFKSFTTVGCQSASRNIAAYIGNCNRIKFIPVRQFNKMLFAREHTDQIKPSNLNASFFPYFSSASFLCGFS